MIVNTLYQMTIGGVVSLVEDRENDFTQEVFVSPISRYAIIIGKIIGSSITSLFQLVGVFAVALLLRIPLGGVDIVRLLGDSVVDGQKTTLGVSFGLSAVDVRNRCG